MAINKKKLFLVIGNSNSGKDYLYNKLKENVTDLVRVSGGDFCKTVSKKLYNYDGVSKTKTDRLLLNKVSKIYRYDKDKIYNDDIYSDFLTNDEFLKYKKEESFWAYCIICKIRNSNENNFMMTDLRFHGEYETFYKYKKEFDIIFIDLVSEESIRTASDMELDKLSILSVSNFKNNYVLFNNRNEEFDYQINLLYKIIYELKTIDVDYFWESIKKHYFFIDNTIHIDLLEKFFKENSWDLNKIENEDDYINYVLFLLLMRYGILFEQLDRMIGFFEVKETIRYLMPINENIKNYLIEKIKLEMENTP